MDDEARGQYQARIAELERDVARLRKIRNCQRCGRPEVSICPSCLAPLMAIPEHTHTGDEIVG